MMMMCRTCEGRGWHWVGEINNAHKEACERCGGKGKLTKMITTKRIKWLAILLLLVFIPWSIITAGMLWFLPALRAGLKLLRAG